VRSLRQQAASKSSLPSCRRIRAVAVHEKRDPGLLRKTGAYRPEWGEGLGAEGTPTRRWIIQRDETDAVPAWNLFQPAAPRRTSAAMHCQPIGLATLPRAGTPWEGEKGRRGWPCAPSLFKWAPQARRRPDANQDRPRVQRRSSDNVHHKFERESAEEYRHQRRGAGKYIRLPP
jgi:hypothetical protein